jgi:hypothetical protein
MKKLDLKTGMRVTLRNGSVSIVLKECSFYEHKDAYNVYVNKECSSWDMFQYWNDDLTGTIYSKYDVMKVEQPRHPYEIFKENGTFKTVWEREELKELTIEEIQQKLGYKIKVVESHKSN